MTNTNYGICVPYTKELAEQSDVSREIRQLMITQLRAELEQTFCVRCRLNFFGCLCTIAEIDEYLNAHPMKIRYAKY